MGAPSAGYDYDHDHLCRLLEEGRRPSCPPQALPATAVPPPSPYRRHTGGRLICALFSVLAIYGFYLLAMSVDDGTTSAPSPVEEGDRASDRNNVGFCFGALGLLVLLGNLWSFVRECWTGGRSSCPRQALPATVAAAPPPPGPSEPPPPPSRGRTPVWASAIRGVSNTIGLLLFVVVVVPLATHCTSKDEVFTCVFLSAMAIAFPAQGYVFTWDQP